MSEFDRAVETVEGGVLTPFTRRGGVVSGCLHRADGVKVALSERFGGWRGDRFRSENPDRLEAPIAADRLPGRALYLGHYMRHYGHFITETLSTFWIFDQIDVRRFDHVALHAFVFGAELAGYALKTFEAFGVPREKIRIVTDRALAFDEVVAPERLLRLNHSADPMLRGVYRRLVAALADGPPGPPRKLYCSRRRLNLRGRKRIIANEHALEHEFARRGFEVIYPETMPFGAQLRLYGSAAAMAGPSGSGLHNVLFMPEGSLLIELGDPRYRGEPSPTQALCDGLAGVRRLFEPFEGRIVGPDLVMVADRARLAARLDASGLPELAPTGAAPGARLLDRLAGPLEAIFILGRGLARRLFGRAEA
jgi:hypothetical protein